MNRDDRIRFQHLVDETRKLKNRIMSDDDETIALCASIAALWEPRPERIADVTKQVRLIRSKLIEWGWGTLDRDEIDHATIMYSRACGVHECCEWLPFDVMPNWEDDLYCLLMDEDRWLAHVEANGHVSELARLLRTENEQRLTPSTTLTGYLKKTK